MWQELVNVRGLLLLYFLCFQNFHRGYVYDGFILDIEPITIKKETWLLHIATLSFMSLGYCSNTTDQGTNCLQFMLDKRYILNSETGILYWQCGWCFCLQISVDLIYDMDASASLSKILQSLICSFIITSPFFSCCTCSYCQQSLWCGLIEVQLVYYQVIPPS